MKKYILVVVMVMGMGCLALVGAVSALEESDSSDQDIGTTRSSFPSTRSKISSKDRPVIVNP